MFNPVPQRLWELEAMSPGTMLIIILIIALLGGLSGHRLLWWRPWALAAHLVPGRIYPGYRQLIAIS